MNYGSDLLNEKLRIFKSFPWIIEQKFRSTLSDCNSPTHTPYVDEIRWKARNKSCLEGEKCLISIFEPNRTIFIFLPPKPIAFYARRGVD